MSQIATQVEVIIAAANAALQNQPPAIPVGGAIIDAAAVTAINAQAALVSQQPIPASQIQQASTPPAGS